MGLGLDLRSDRLYDLVGDIPDAMRLRAIQPSAAIVNVMSVPDSHCIRVVTPDLADEELPFVAVSNLGCLRLDWPKTLSTFMSRYQFDLDQMRRECRHRFGSTQSGACTTYTAESEQTCRLIPHGAGAAVAMPSDLVYSLEGNSPGLC